MSYFKCTNNNWVINRYMFVISDPAHLGAAVSYELSRGIENEMSTC